MEKIKKHYSQIWLLLLLLLWEFASRTGLVSKFILPPFSEVIIRICQEVFSHDLGLKILNSMMLIITGCAASIVISILFTIGATRSEALSSLFYMLCTVFNPLPGVALLPMIMLWFGIGNGAMLALIAHGVVWPLTSDLLSGYRSMPTVYRELSQNFNIRPIHFFFKILIYSVMPNFLSGLRVGWGRAWRALISAEMIFGTIGSLGGIGYYIYNNRVYADITGVMAGVVIVVVIGMAVEWLFKRLEKVTVYKWGIVHD